MVCIRPTRNAVTYMPHHDSHCTEQLFVITPYARISSDTTLDLQAQQKLNLLTIEESCAGPSHAVTWTVTYRRMFMCLCSFVTRFMRITVDGEALGTGSGPQKWQAKDAAAKEALQKLNQT